MSLIIRLEILQCGVAGNVGNIAGRPIVRHVNGGDLARVAAWPWHAAVSLHRNSVTEVCRAVSVNLSLKYITHYVGID